MQLQKRNKTETTFHCHPCAQVFCLQRGLLSLHTKTQTFLIPSGQVVFIPHRCHHRAEIMGETVGWSVYLPTDLIGFNKVTSFEATDLLKSLLEKVSEDQRLGHGTRDQSIKKLIFHEMKSVRPTHLSLPFPTSPHLKAVAERIYQANHLTVKEAAKVAAMSERNFSRCFKAETGLCFEHWRRRVLNEVAIKFLIAGKSVSTVAEETGFQTVSAFIASFKKQFGYSPKKMLKGLSPLKADH